MLWNVLKTLERVKGRIENITELYDNVYINICDLDEIIFKRKEVLNYEACISDNMLIRLEIDLQISNHIFAGNGRLKRKI